MGTRNLRRRYPWRRGIALCSWALLVILATDAPAITFSQWATSQGWPAGYVTPATVNASSASISSLAGIGDYDWTTTPTETLWLSGNQITSIESGSFSGLGSLGGLYLASNTRMTSLNLEGADFSSLSFFELRNNTSITRVSLRSTVLTQTALAATVIGGDLLPWLIGIGDLPGVTELDLSGVDFASVTDLSPLYLMDNLTDLWLVDVENLDADALDVLLDNLAVMEDPGIEGALYLTQADFDAFNTAGDGKLALWDAEPGHHVEIIGMGDANADGVVDDKDASILGAHWLQTGNWLDGDFNGDGNVNDADAAILAAHWVEGTGDADVPEPAAWAMLAGAAVSLLASRRAGKSTRRRWTRFAIWAIVIGACMLLAISPTGARAVTFGQWATSQGWPAGYVMPASVGANGKSIDSLAGISDYDWTATPTTTLALQNNQITSIESGDFSGLGSLTYLYLYGNHITSIESGDFSGLGNLNVLSLSSSEITSIESGDFSGLGSLTYLYLDRNQITSIESGDFSGLGSLTNLYLYSNQITSIGSGSFSGLGRLYFLGLDRNPALTELNLDNADFSSLIRLDLANDTSVKRVMLRSTVLTQRALAALVTGGSSAYIGIGELPGVTELDLSGVDFAPITDLSPLYLMDSLTDLWLVDVENLDADALDVLLDNLAVMEDPGIEGALYLTQADFDAFNTAGGGKLAAWDAEPGHHVRIIGLGDANADFVVDDKDASVLGAHWLQAGTWAEGDFNADGNVNDADAAILAAHWGEGVGEESVPEPGSLALLAGMAVMGMVYLRRRKA